jgi:hypothetical protein
LKLDLEELRHLQGFLAEVAIERAIIHASPKQIAFADDFFARTHDVYVAMGGNRSGKSFVCGWLCFALYLRDYAKNGDWFWCIGQSESRSIVGQQQELAKALPRWMLGKQSWDAKKGFGGNNKVILNTRDGGTCLVEFLNVEQGDSKFEQAKLTGIWVDERLPETIYNRILARVVDRNGFILYSDIPEQFWHIGRLKEALPEARVLYQAFSMYDNAHNLPVGAIERTANKMTEEERKLRIDGEHVIMEGIVFREFINKYLPDGHLCKPFAIPADWPRWRLIDYGASAPTACLWVAMSPTEKLFCYREYYQKGLTVGKNAAAIIAMSMDEVYRDTFLDPHASDQPPAFYAAAGTIKSQYERAGLVTRGWPYVNQMGEHAMVQRIKYRLENKTIVFFDTLFNMLREMRSWKYQLDKDGKPKAVDAFENDNNHLIDGLKGFLGTNPCYTQRMIET